MLYTTYLLLAAIAPAGLNAEFHGRFADASIVDQSFAPFGPSVAQSLILEGDGLLIDVPAGGGAPVGLAAQFDIFGDFEITLAYEMVHTTPPSKGTGAGVKMWGQMGGPQGQAVSLGHLLRTGGRENAVLTFKRGGTDGKQVYKAAPTKARAGRLRMIRTGTEISFQHAAGDSDAFTEIHRVIKVREEPLKAFRISAVNGGDSGGLTVKLIDLHVRAERLGSQQDFAARSNTWIAVFAIVLIVALVGGGLGYNAYRQRKAREDAA